MALPLRSTLLSWQPSVRSTSMSARADVALRLHLPSDLRAAAIVGVASVEGGAGGSFTSALLVIEELARVDPAVSVMLDIHSTVVNNTFSMWGSASARQSGKKMCVVDGGDIQLAASRGTTPSHICASTPAMVVAVDTCSAPPSAPLPAASYHPEIAAGPGPPLSP